MKIYDTSIVQIRSLPILTLLLTLICNILFYVIIKLLLDSYVYIYTLGLQLLYKYSDEYFNDKTARRKGVRLVTK